jgi:predicted RNA-binding protein with PIN domain
VFLSLPIGIPLDTQDRLPETSSNKEFAQMQAARNNIMDQLIAYANTMEPGQDIVIDLQVQLRRVKETQEVSTKVGENKFAMDLGLLESK